MRIIESITEMQHQSEAWRREGKSIALVPTMGFLHKGHLTLMRAVRSRADLVGISIFVNPTQFRPGEDYEKYPRDLERDVQLASEAGVDFAFAPTVAEMYPKGYQTTVDVSGVTQPLCGVSRPGHFCGVTTVVCKLFHIVQPHVAIFGEKDYQQLLTIRRMVQDLNLPVEILGHPIVRESDGLAMSSRNVYLSSDQRTVALRLNRSLALAQSLVDRGEREAVAILHAVRTLIEEGNQARVDYAELRTPDSLEEVTRLEGGPALLALAVFIGVTRLIDNRVLQPPKSA